MPLPRTIAEYLEQLRAALRGADPALIQDALYDAEDHLRSELAENPGKSEARCAREDRDDLRRARRSRGASMSTRNSRCSRRCAHRRRREGRRRSGGSSASAADPRAYASLFYMMLSLATGIFYFVWAVAGISLSVGLSILIFGLAFAVLFFGTVRVLSLVEGRIIEVMLGERMPRRPVYAERGKPVMTRIKEMFTDPRTWSTLLYMLLMLPLGIVYFTMAVTGVTTLARAHGCAGRVDPSRSWRRRYGRHLHRRRIHRAAADRAAAFVPHRRRAAVSRCCISRAVSAVFRARSPSTCS